MTRCWQQGSTASSRAGRSFRLARSRIVTDLDAVTECAVGGRVHARLLDTQRLADTLLANLETVDPAFQVWVRAKRQALHDRLNILLGRALADADAAAGEGSRDRASSPQSRSDLRGRLSPPDAPARGQGRNRHRAQDLQDFVGSARGRVCNRAVARHTGPRRSNQAADRLERASRRRAGHRAGGRCGVDRGSANSAAPATIVHHASRPSTWPGFPSRCVRRSMD